MNTRFKKKSNRSCNKNKLIKLNIKRKQRQPAGFHAGPPSLVKLEFVVVDF